MSLLKRICCLEVDWPVPTRMTLQQIVGTRNWKRSFQEVSLQLPYWLSSAQNFGSWNHGNASTGRCDASSSPMSCWIHARHVCFSAFGERRWRWSKSTWVSWGLWHSGHTCALTDDQGWVEEANKQRHNDEEEAVVRPVCHTISLGYRVIADLLDVWYTIIVLLPTVEIIRTCLVSELYVTTGMVLPGNTERYVLWQQNVTTFSTVDANWKQRSHDERSQRCWPIFQNIFGTDWNDCSAWDEWLGCRWTCLPCGTAALATTTMDRWAALGAVSRRSDQTDRQPESQRASQPDRETDRERERGRKTERRTERLRDGQTDRQTGKTDR